MVAWISQKVAPPKDEKKSTQDVDDDDDISNMHARTGPYTPESELYI